MRLIRSSVIAFALAGALLSAGRLQAQEQAELEQAVAYGMSLSDEAWIGMIPKRSRGIFWTTCPHCKIRTRTARWQWVPEKPDVITCEDCRTRFPDPRYPENGEVTVKAPGGGTHRFTYYQEPVPAVADFESLPSVWRQTWKDKNDLADGRWRLYPDDTTGKLYRSEVSEEEGCATIYRNAPSSVTLSRALEKEHIPGKGAFYLEAELLLPSGKATREVELIFGLEPWVQVEWGSGGLVLRGSDQRVALGGEAGGTATLRFLIRPGKSRIEGVWRDGEEVALSAPVMVKAKKGAHPTLFLTGAPGSTQPIGVGRLEIRSVRGSDKGKEPTQYFLSSTADYFSRKYVVEQTKKLASLYDLTKEDRYARRIAMTLEEFAKVYPGYPYITDGSWHGKPTEFYPYDQPVVKGGNRPSRWEFWGYMDISTELLTAYESIRNWSGWSAQEQVEKHLFRLQVADVSRFPETYHNMSVAHAWPGLFLAARVLKDPGLFHETFRKLERFMVKDFLYDGYWKETSPSYAAMTNGGLMRISRYIKGYSDPEGYLDPVSQRRFDDLDPDRVLPGAAALRETLMAARFPDGRYLPINDTWGSIKQSLQVVPVKREAGLFPGFGVALLQTTVGVPFSAYLNFTSGRMHKQFDTLSIGLFAQDKEYLSTIGYTHTRYRPWAKSAMSKNSVIVDGREPEMDPGHVGNRLVLFASDNAPETLFSLAAARSITAYPKRTSRYERHLALIGGTENVPYLIDIFLVKGGRQHDYLLHSSVDEDSEAVIEGVTLKPFGGSLMNPGTQFIPPVIEGSNIGGPEAGYGFIRNLKEGMAESDGATLLFRYQDGERGLRSRLLSRQGDHYFLGEGPSVRRAGGRHFKEDESLLDRDQAPVFCWRREGENLESTFIAVHQLLKDPPIKVERLISPPGLIALRLEQGNGKVDYYLQSIDPTMAKVELSTPDGPLAFEGRAGFLRLREGSVREARLIGKGILQLGSHVLDQPDGEPRGRVIASGDAPEPFVDVSESITLPPGKHAMILTFPDGTERSFNVLEASPRPDGKGTRLRVREQMGFTKHDGKIVFTSFPTREVSGEEMAYALPLMKSASWKETP